MHARARKRWNSFYWRGGRVRVFSEDFRETVLSEVEIAFGGGWCGGTGGHFKEIFEESGIIITEIFSLLLSQTRGGYISRRIGGILDDGATAADF